MLQKYKKHIWLTGLVSLLLLLSACSVPGLASNSITPQQTLQNSAKAMGALTSVHVDLQAALNLQPATTTSGGSSSGMTFNVTGHGDATSSNQADLSVLLGTTPLLSVIRTGGKIYVQGRNGTWYVTNESNVTDGMQKFFSQNLATGLGSLVGELQNATLTDHGSETLNGETLDHITVTLDAQTLQTLSTQLNNLLPSKQQSTQNALNQATLDLWIDPSTWYIHQAKLNLAAHIDLSKLPELDFNGQSFQLPAEVLPVSLNAQLNFSKFDQPVSIQPPSNAQLLPLS